MKIERNSKAAAALVGGLGVALLSGGTAYAFWTATGTGSGSAKASTMQAVTFATATATGTQLYPGLTADGTTAGGDLIVLASNPNPFPVTVTVTSTGSSGCTTPSVSIPTFAPGVTANTFTLGPNASGQTRTMSKVLSMGTGANNDCQGATISVALSATAVSG